MLSRSLSTSEKFANLSAQCELAEFCQVLYVMLIPHTDDFGKLQGDPFTVKHQCFPASPRSIPEFATALTALHNAELLIWYEVTGKKFIQITNFDPHQVGLSKRTKSRFPEIPEIPEVHGNSVKVSETPAPSEKITEIPSELNLTELKGTELKRTELVQQQPQIERDAIPEAKPPNGNGHGPAPLLRRNPHAKHAMCGRVCLPADLFDDLVRFRGGDEEKAGDEVRQFFRDWNIRYTSGDRSGETIGDDAFAFWRARWGESHTKNTPQVPSSAKDFLAWFRAEYAAHRNGAVYFIKPDKHPPIIERLLATHAMERLKQHAQILWTTDEDWVETTDRGIEVLALKINWLEDRLSRWEAKKHAHG